MRRRPHFSSRALVALALLAALCPSLAQAARVVGARAYRQAQWLVVDVDTADLLDSRTRSTVESGLPGSCLLQIELRAEGDGTAAMRRVERSLEYDLWEDVVRLREAGREAIFSSLAAADSAWSRFRSMRLARWTSLLPSRSYRLRVRVEVVPLGPRERERVSKWVSEADRGEGREYAIDVGGLVERFLGGGRDESGADTWEGPPFRLEELLPEGPPQSPEEDGSP